MLEKRMSVHAKHLSSAPVAMSAVLFASAIPALGITGILSVLLISILVLVAGVLVLVLRNAPVRKPVR